MLHNIILKIIKFLVKIKILHKLLYIIDICKIDNFGTVPYGSNVKPES